MLSGCCKGCRWCCNGLRGGLEWEVRYEEALDFGIIPLGTHKSYQNGTQWLDSNQSSTPACRYFHLESLGIGKRQMVIWYFFGKRDGVTERWLQPCKCNKKSEKNPCGSILMHAKFQYQDSLVVSVWTKAGPKTSLNDCVTTYRTRFVTSSPENHSP